MAPKFRYERFLLQTVLFIVLIGAALSLNVQGQFLQWYWVAIGVGSFPVIAFATKTWQNAIIDTAKKHLKSWLLESEFVKQPLSGTKEQFEAVEKLFRFFKEIVIVLIAIVSFSILYAISQYEYFSSQKTIVVRGKVEGHVKNDTITIDSSQVLATPVFKELSTARVYVKFLNDKHQTEGIIKCNSNGLYEESFDVDVKTEYAILTCFDKDGYIPDVVNEEISNKTISHDFTLAKKHD